MENQQTIEICSWINNPNLNELKTILNQESSQMNHR